MDILISSNLERFLFDISGCDDVMVSELMKKLNENGVYEVNETMKKQISDLLYAGCCDDNKTKESINKCFKDYGYVIDTHTAVAKAVHDEYIEKTGDITKTVIASTASPFKFSQSVLIALEGCGYVAGKDEFTLLDDLSAISEMNIPKSLADLINKNRIFDVVC